MAGEEMKLHRLWKWNNLAFYLSAMLVSLVILSPPATADILVVDMESNETSPIFEDLTAAFGPNFPHRGLSGRIVYSNPPEACIPVQPPPGPREDNIGWILVIARGGHCGFADKVLAAQQKGYDAVIVHNYQGKESLVRMYGNENASFINIPSTFVGWQEGKRLKNEYDYTFKKYYVKVIEQDDINYKLYLWPFAIVVAVCFVLVMVFVIVKFVREHASRRINRLSKKHLKKIPVRKYKKGDYYDTCAICLDEYEEGEKIRVLPCDHVYHTKCIDPWLTKNKKTCPVCKRRVMPGRDADDSDSDNDGNINSSERTPLLTESGSGSPGGSRSPAQYTNSTTPSLHSSVYLAQPRHGRSGARSADPTVPTQSDGAQGAVGGAGISDQFATLSDETDVTPQLRNDPGRRKRRRPDWRKAGVWGEEEPTETLPVHGRVEEPVTETKEERRERRRKKKERKREALASSARKKAEHEAATESSRLREEGMGHNVAVEVADDSNSEAAATLSVEVLPSGAGCIQAPESRNRDTDDRDESYINPSYSESQELVLHNPGRRHEMNDMV